MIKLNTVIFFSLMALFSSCKGQNESNNLKDKSGNLNSTLRIGEVVSEMGSSLTIIYQDNQNNFWFGSKEQGVYKYDGKNITHFSVENGLCNNRIRGIQEDDAGNIYFDTGDGINKFDGQIFTTLNLDTTASKKDWKIEPGDLWFEGNWNKNGPYRYDGKKLYHLEFPKHQLEDEFFSINPNAPFNPYEVYKIYKDSKGNLWFGTSTFGACRYDGQSLSWISERDMVEMDEGPAPGVRSILEDKEGNFWYSSNINHKYKVHPASLAAEQDKLKYEKLKGIETSKEPKLNNYFMSITQDDSGDVWMAKYDGAVWRYDGKNLIHYPIKDGNTNVLIFTIYKDKQGDLWLGTHNAGALRFNGKTFEKFVP